MLLHITFYRSKDVFVLKLDEDVNEDEERHLLLLKSFCLGINAIESKSLIFCSLDSRSFLCVSCHLSNFKLSLTSALLTIAFLTPLFSLQTSVTWLRFTRLTSVTRNSAIPSLLSRWAKKTSPTSIFA